MRKIYLRICLILSCLLIFWTSNIYGESIKTETYDLGYTGKLDGGYGFYDSTGDNSIYQMDLKGIRIVSGDAVYHTFCLDARRIYPYSLETATTSVDINDETLWGKNAGNEDIIEQVVYPAFIAVSQLNVGTEEQNIAIKQLLYWRIITVIRTVKFESVEKAREQLYNNYIYNFEIKDYNIGENFYKFRDDVRYIINHDKDGNETDVDNYDDAFGFPSTNFQNGNPDGINFLLSADNLRRIYNKYNMNNDIGENIKILKAPEGSGQQNQIIFKYEEKNDIYNVYDVVDGVIQNGGNPRESGKISNSVNVSANSNYYNNYKYLGYRRGNTGNYNGNYSVTINKDDNSHNIYFYYESYHINVRHILVQNDGNISLYGEGQTDSLKYNMGMPSNQIKVWLNEKYSKKTNISLDAPSGVSIDGNTNSPLWLNINSAGDYEITVYYTPGVLKVHRILYYPRYYLGDNPNQNPNYQTNSDEIKMEERGYLSRNGNYVDSNYSFSDNNTNYWSYMSGRDDSKKWGYDTESINYDIQKEDIDVYLYYESRYIYQRYYDEEYRDISDTISKNYKIKCNSPNYNLDYNGNIGTKYITFKDSIEYEFNLKLYAQKDSFNYTKYNFVNFEISKRNFFDNDSNGSNWNMSESNINLLKTNTQNIIELLKMDGNGYNHSDAYKLDLKYQIEPPVNVYVRHLVKNNEGNYTLATNINPELSNSNAVGTVKELYKNENPDALKVLPNKFSERKSVYDEKISTIDKGIVGYSEYYEIDANDSLYVNRLSTVILDGTKYNCIGYKKNHSAMSINAGGLIKNKNLCINVGETTPGVTIYVDYYYEPEDYSKTVYKENEDSIGTNSNLKFVSVKSENYQNLDNSNDSVASDYRDGKTIQTAYVPASESLRPYFVSEICRPRNLKYEIGVADGNKISYEVEKYTAYGINTNSNVIGTVEGITGNRKDAVYTSGSSTEVVLSNDGNNKVREKINGTVGILNENSNSLFAASATSSNSSLRNVLDEIKSIKTEKSWFESRTSQNVSSDKYNGLRYPTAIQYYLEYNVMSGSKWGAENGIVTNDRAMDVNVYTPFKIDKINIISNGEVVDHTTDLDSNTSVIQQNANFTIEVKAAEGTCYSDLYKNVTNVAKYLKNYYLRFDFDVMLNERATVWKCSGDTFEGGRTYGAGEVIPAKSIIRIGNTGGTGSMSFKAYSTESSTVRVNYDNIKAYASTINVKDEDFVINKIKQSSVKSNDGNTNYIDNEYIERKTGYINYQVEVSSMLNDAYYICSKKTQAISVGRIFDFEITDCLDVNFKNVFRKSDTNTVNDLTGIAYFAGTKRLLLRDAIAGYNVNFYMNRTGLDRGIVKTIVPLGPYKNTSNQYIQAPKLGYRFAFDVKTSGYYDPNDNESYNVKRVVKITPSYYYISKNGDPNTYTEDIDLYYKNSSGNYTKFTNSGYTIAFKPNDGYRTILTDETTPDTSHLTTDVKALNISKQFELNGSTMLTRSDWGFIQSWYGEFKLPNSTIVLAKTGENSNINNPLTGGYIGVKFDIICVDTYNDGTNTRTVTVSYNTPDKNAGGNVNTTQWDYEGYLGYNIERPNDYSNMKLQFENGSLSINDDMYKKIKGTVIFYDTDSRAADDFN